MYKCRMCGIAFDFPFVQYYNDQTVDCKATFRDVLCPICFKPYIDEAESCPGCDGYKFKGEILCKDCREALLDRIKAFADELTAEQEQQLDEWLDGDTIENRRKWA